MTLHDVEWFLGGEALLDSDGTLFTIDTLGKVDDNEYYALCIVYGISTTYPPTNGNTY